MNRLGRSTLVPPNHRMQAMAGGLGRVGPGVGRAPTAPEPEREAYTDRS